MRNDKHYRLEINALTKLAAEMTSNGIPVRNKETCDQAQDFLNQIRNPNPSQKFDKSYLDMLEWALLIGKTIDPGDGHLDLFHALDRVSI